MNSKEQIKILLKDIQDTYLLVKRFENLSEVPKIEMDLALSKVRNLYDLLLKVDVEKLDSIPEVEKDEIVVDTTDKESEEARILEWKLAKEKELEKEKERKKQQEEAEKELAKQTEALVEDKKAALVSEEEEVEEKKVELEIEETPVLEEKEIQEEVKEDKVEQEEPKVEVVAEEVQNHEPELIIEKPVQEEFQEAEKTIVADRFKNKRSMHDSIADSSTKVDRAAKMQQKPIKDMHNAIGLNDKFLFIRELFEGNKEKYWETIQVLNNFDSFENAQAFLSEEFSWDFEDSTVKRLVEIIQRKFAN